MIAKIKLYKPYRFLVPVRLIFLLAFCFSGLRILSQNTIHETISTNGISKIVIDGYQIFNIEVKAKRSKEITINSLTDGEYQNEYKIISEIKGEQLLIKLQKTPLYNIPDDKRNAHMVVAANLKVVIPENLELFIRSDIGSVKAEGKFKNLSIQLFQGSAFIIGKAATAMINTFDGNITVTTTNAFIEATSNNGLISVEEDDNKTAHWILKSIDGDITVLKPQ